MVRRIHLRVHCAPLERQELVGHEGYKHLAPLEPEHRLVYRPAELCRAFSFTPSPFPPFPAPHVSL